MYDHRPGCFNVNVVPFPEPVCGKDRLQYINEMKFIVDISVTD